MDPPVPVSRVGECSSANLFKFALLLAVARLLTKDLLARNPERPGRDTRFACEAGQTQLGWSLSNAS